MLASRRWLRRARNVEAPPLLAASEQSSGRQTRGQRGGHRALMEDGIPLQCEGE